MGDHPEFPYLGAGILAIIGGAIKQGKWPSNTVGAALGTIVLVLLASATANTRVAPLVKAVGFLFLLAAIMSTITVVSQKKKSK